ncbi:MAG: DUF1080 domain-containing protein [Kiritimatiellae bacterium]|nr:DUF1080 domain-containing protein [Kiritimatiellia bacterium]
MTIASILIFAAIYGDTPDMKHAWAVHDINRPKPAKVEVNSKGVPSDAIVLFDGTKESFEKNWRDDKGNASKWSYSKDGYFFTVPGWNNGGNIFTREEFGDCQLHVEFRHDPSNIITDQGAQMRGNSGVFLMNNYEIQVLESYYTSKDAEGTSQYVNNYADGQAGSVYAENPPMVNPAKKPGEWQVYDIVFHQPVWKGGKLVHPGSITVFFNGVLVQDHWEMEGLTTHCVRRPLKEHVTKGPLVFQDHGCIVQFRNIWYRPLPSRWANLTHSNLSACPEKVMELRRETAAKLFAKIKDPKKASADNIKALAEVISYANEGEYAASFWCALEAYRAKKGSEQEVKSVNAALGVLIRNKIIPESAKIK